MVSGRCLIAGGHGFYVHVHVEHVLSHDWLLGLHGGDLSRDFSKVSHSQQHHCCQQS